MDPWGGKGPSRFPKPWMHQKTEVTIRLVTRDVGGGSFRVHAGRRLPGRSGMMCVHEYCADWKRNARCPGRKASCS